MRPAYLNYVTETMDCLPLGVTITEMIVEDALEESQAEISNQTHDDCYGVPHPELMQSRAEFHREAVHHGAHSFGTWH